MKNLLFKLNPWAQAKFWQKLLREERERSAKLEQEAYLLREELDSIHTAATLKAKPSSGPPDIFNIKSYS